MSIYYQDEWVTLYHGDCLDVLASMPDNSVDSIVTDPPYGLSNTKPVQVADVLKAWVTGDTASVPAKRGGFMGKDWDSFVPPPAVWEECLRVLKPGGHMAVFAGARTQDLMGLSIRLAGFEIRDSLAWLYGSGFPKSMDVSKAVESTIHTGKSNSRSLRKTEQDGDGESYSLTGKNNGIMGETRVYDRKRFTPQHDAAQQWDGWGTALKPAIEPIILARKPLVGTVAKNVLEHGTGGINIDACRIGATVETWPKSRMYGGNPSGVSFTNTSGDAVSAQPTGEAPAGRWPANVLLDEHAAAWVDEQSGVSVSPPVGSVARTKGGQNIGTFSHKGRPPSPNGHGDSGGASRFFYCAKAPKSERPNVDGIQHPTVKPLAIMRWLTRLITPPGGTVLDPFAGSGTTIEAAITEGFHPVGIEMETDYLPLITARIARAKTAVQETLDLGGTA